MNLSDLFSFLGLLLLNLSREFVERLQEEEEEFSAKQVANSVKKMQCVLKLTKNLCASMCDSLGDEFQNLTAALAVIIVLNDWRVLEIEKLSEDLKQKVSSVHGALIRQSLHLLLFRSQRSCQRWPSACWRSF